MSLSVRVATKEDAVLIADISRQTFYDTFAAANTRENMDLFLSTQFTRGKLIMEVGSFGNTFLLAQEGEQVAGYVKLRESRPPRSLGTLNAIEIARLYSMVDKIGKGVGKLLMQASLDWSKQIGADAVWLGVWEKNQRAIDFYTKWGFEKFDETDFLLGRDLQRDWLMRKFL
jgi:ribosomal protein S18 acetylase RimI-like enzyme